MDEPDKLFREALEHQRAGELEEAVKIYETFLSIAPGQSDAMNNLGVCLLELDRVNEAIFILSNAAKRSQEDPELLNNLGNALQKSLRTEEAVAHRGRSELENSRKPNYSSHTSSWNLKTNN